MTRTRRLAIQIKLSDAVEKFRPYLRTNYAASTARGIQATLEKFLAETGNIYVSNLTASHLDRFCDARRAGGTHAHTLRNNLSHLRAFFSWCRARHYAGQGWEPIGRRRTPRVVPSPKLRIPADEFEALLDAAEDPRDRAAIALGLYTLSRASEIATIKINDLHLDTGAVDVQLWKSGRVDSKPVSAELDVEMRRWLVAYTAKMGRELEQPWFLIPTRPSFGRSDYSKCARDERGRIVAVETGDVEYIPTSSPTRIHRFVQNALAAIGYTDLEGEGMHTLRRSGARARFDQLVADGYDGALRQVAAMLDHKSTATTEIYLGLDLDVHKRNEAVRGRHMYAEPSRKLRVVK